MIFCTFSRFTISLNYHKILTFGKFCSILSHGIRLTEGALESEPLKFVSPRMSQYGQSWLFAIILADQLHKIGRHVALPGNSVVYSLFSD